MSSGKLAMITAALLLSSAVARADVEIANRPTSNMSCDAGVCTATAQKAVLNVSDLATMLASGDVSVNTGSIAKDIDIDQPLTWSNTSRLTLDAQQSVTVKKQVTVAGQGALTVVTNDTGGAKAKNKAGEFVVVPEHGSVQFWDLGSSLIIDGNSYTLIGDIKTLAADIAANPSGFYALAKPYDASADGVYSSSPVQTTFLGLLDGLGNSISNLTIEFAARHDGVIIGLFSLIGASGQVREIALPNIYLQGTSATGEYGAIGALAGGSEGLIDHVWTTVTLELPGGSGAQTGGIVGENDGKISNSYAVAKVRAKSGLSNVAGFAGANYGTIRNSYASGSVSGDKNDASENVGGLIGRNAGIVEDVYALNSVRRGGGCCGSLGGLIGENDSGGQVSTSYAAGQITWGKNGQGDLGAFVGTDNSEAGNLQFTYWNLEKGIGDPAQGAGNRADDPGITGLTTTQLQGALPTGFSPKIWGLAAQVNDGYPYLLSLPSK